MVSMGEVVYVVVQKNIPLKQKDLGAFTIPCVIDNASFKRAFNIIFFDCAFFQWYVSLELASYFVEITFTLHVYIKMIKALIRNFNHLSQKANL